MPRMYQSGAERECAQLMRRIEYHATAGEEAELAVEWYANEKLALATNATNQLGWIAPVMKYSNNEELVAADAIDGRKRESAQ